MDNVAPIKLYLTEELRTKFLETETLVIGGGSLYFVDLLGFLSALQENSMLPNFKWIFSTSGGSIAALFIIMNFNIRSSFQNYLLNENTTRIVDRPFISLFSFVFRGYFEKESKFKQDYIRLIFNEGLGVNDIDFLNLYERTGKHFVVLLSSKNTGQSVYASPLTTPYLSVIDAVDATTNLQNVWSPKRIEIPYRGVDYYYDGITAGNFPIAALLKRCSRDYYGNQVPENKKKNVSIPEIGSDPFFGIRIKSESENFAQFSITNQFDAPKKRNLNLAQTFLMTDRNLLFGQNTVFLDSIKEKTAEIVGENFSLRYDLVTNKTLTNYFNNGQKYAYIATNIYLQSGGKQFSEIET